MTRQEKTAEEKRWDKRREETRWEKTRWDDLCGNLAHHLRYIFLNESKCVATITNLIVPKKRLIQCGRWTCSMDYVIIRLFLHEILYGNGWRLTSSHSENLAAVQLLHQSSGAQSNYGKSSSLSLTLVPILYTSHQCAKIKHPHTSTEEYLHGHTQIKDTNAALEMGWETLTSGN